MKLSRLGMPLALFVLAACQVSQQPRTFDNQTQPPLTTPRVDDPAPGLPGVPGVTIAARLNERYRNTVDSCAHNLPAYYCSGVILRATQNSDNDPWNPSTSAIKLGGVSFSYMRVDAYVDDVYYNSGFTFLDQNDAIAQDKAMNYLCVYAYDAVTSVGTRPAKGCGLKPASAVQTSDLSTCSSVKATTVDQWYAYTRTIPMRDFQCSLSTSDAAQFATSYKVRAKRLENMDALWNELLVAVWPQDYANKLPLEAFFYKNATGLAEAKIYQAKYRDRTGGGWLPIIKLDLTQVKGNPFSYNAADQAVKP